MTKTIKQTDVRRQLALAVSKRLIDSRGRITDVAMEQARKACEALARRVTP
jgi:hypothetical protein